MNWHHAYNGIPTVRDTGGKNGTGFAGDGAPSGQDRLAPDTVSGELALTITVASPTIPGQSTADRRVVVASRSGDPEGARTWEDATIPVTTLKGVLSSAYEAVTASRMRVFADHDHVLTHRHTTQEATTLYPVFLVDDNGPHGVSETGLSARLMLGLNDPKDVRRNWDRPNYVCAAVLPNDPRSATALYDSTGAWMYSGSRKRDNQERKRGVSTTDVNKRLDQLRTATPHLKPITFTVQTEKFYDSQRAVVASIDGERFCGTRDEDTPPSSEEYTGVVVRLTPRGSRPLIGTKYNEFVFFDTEKNRTRRPVSTDVLEQLVEVIHSYLLNIRQLIEREKAGTPGNSKTRKSTDSKTWLIHEIANGKIDDHGKILGASDPEAHELKESAVMADRAQIKQFLRTLASKGPGIPLFASVSDDGHITGLMPSQVGRRAAPDAVSPASLAKDSQVAPARTHSQASAGDRMWGFVADEKDKDRSQAAAARGHITIRPVMPALPQEGRWLHTPKTDSLGWRLRTLANPKPSTGFPYLRDEQGRTLAESTTRADAYQPGRTLIRKVYPTHRRLLGREDLPNSRRLEGGIGPHDTVAGSFLAPGAKFTTTLTFEGLVPEELAVLVWLLTPERLVPPDASPKDESKRRGYHRLGFGKPLGLGAVEIRATDVCVHAGKELAEMYAQLSGCLGCLPTDTTTTASDRLANALDALPSDFENSLPVRAFMRAAYGWDGKAVVQYPDADKPADSKTGVSATTNWFKNREENRVNHGINPRKFPIDPNYDLPDLLATPGEQDASSVSGSYKSDQPGPTASKSRQRRRQQRKGDQSRKRQGRS
ncbi:hypothetical protein [Actinomyces glycerinitolerans]|uniref:CRISPR-associated protein n=1 Tax=Actinomyces glycerinitolerans TaxID=1892869 RepID=A0A1M4RZJ0_9ACTO|nr:hypothetical protein [Actinomyces glycerinitolerans]SHE25394.1 Hypothetical protein ACGLYG10_1610 [Actinomyces glycerinitolerans]